MDLKIIQSKIYEIRGCRVMLDSDLAALYQVETKALKQAVKRNLDRFPDDFMFELTKEETECLRSQIVTLEKGADDETNLRSLEVTNCDLKMGWLSLSKFRVYRAGGRHDFIRSKK